MLDDRLRAHVSFRAHTHARARAAGGAQHVTRARALVGSGKRTLNCPTTTVVEFIVTGPRGGDFNGIGRERCNTVVGSRAASDRRTYGTHVVDELDRSEREKPNYYVEPVHAVRI